jgi:hypothetical protein
MSRRALSWQCYTCGVDVAADEECCPMCLIARPMDRTGYPQIFQDLVVHFNGIIPRTLKHPSHSVEWRMMERHGGRCTNVFDPQVVTTLVYRTGYERSDKVRLCVERYLRIPCVPISWMLDSLLQSRQIHPSLYRLQVVPAVALPTVRGSNLPHHQHPFYVMNADEYSLSATLALKKQTSSILTATTSGKQGDAKLGIPRPRPVPEPEFEAADVWEAARVASVSGKSVATFSITSSTAAEEDGFEIEPAGGSARKGLELFSRQLSSNKCNAFLFRGMRFILSETLVAEPVVADVLSAYGATVVSVDPALQEQDLVEFLARSQATVIFHGNDKKRGILIHAAVARTVPMASATWVEDCMLLDETLPTGGPYAPSAKLLNTLQKKFEKREK